MFVKVKRVISAPCGTNRRTYYDRQPLIRLIALVMALLASMGFLFTIILSRTNVVSTDPSILQKVKEVSVYNRQLFFDPNEATQDVIPTLGNSTEGQWKCQNRQREMHDNDLNVDCESIFNRSPFHTRPPTDFPIAFAKIVYTDYAQQELTLFSSYSPSNVYCFSVDVMADASFRERMAALAACLPNVFVSRVNIHADSSGHNMIRAFLECLRDLLSIPLPWEYVVLLQNHDVPLRTPKEIADVLQYMNGSNDIEMLQKDHYVPRIRNVSRFTPRHLLLFPQEKIDQLGINPDNMINISKGYVQAALSRPFVEYLFNRREVRPWLFEEWLSEGDYGVDEFFFSSMNRLPNAPGGFDHDCLSRRDSYAAVRTASWEGYDPCPSNIFRHSVCILVQDDIQRMLQWKTLFANKMMQKQDFGSIECLHEAVIDRALRDPVSPSQLVGHLPHVRHGRGIPKQDLLCDRDFALPTTYPDDSSTSASYPLMFPCQFLYYIIIVVYRWY